MSKVRFQIGDEVDRCAFRNHSDLDVAIAIGESPQRPRCKFLAQMQRAIVLCAPDGIFVQPFFRPE